MPVAIVSTSRLLGVVDAADDTDDDLAEHDDREQAHPFDERAASRPRRTPSV
jgi:hypothetical protein